jgi:5-hydroxyisourate hydrolase
MTATISTHVLDAATGRPASGMDVVVERLDGTVIARGTTNDDGRIPGLLADGVNPGDYRIVFDTGG